MDYHRPPTKRGAKQGETGDRATRKGTARCPQRPFTEIHREEEQPRYRAPDRKAIRELYPPADSRILQRKSEEIDRDRDCRPAEKDVKNLAAEVQKMNGQKSVLVMRMRGCHRYTPQTLLRPGR